MVFSMLKFNLVLALLLANSSAYAEDEKFISCVIEREKQDNPYFKSDDTYSDSKSNQPLISIKDGKFRMLIGYADNEELFPDGIQYHFIGEPKLNQRSNTYQWDYTQNISEVGGTEVYMDWNVIINRESLDMSQSHRDTDMFGKFAIDRYYSCRLIDKESFEKYKAELSEKNMELNAERRKKKVERRKKEKEEQVERESKSKI
jgi:hypothetical protein